MPGSRRAGAPLPHQTAVIALGVLAAVTGTFFIFITPWSAISSAHPPTKTAPILFLVYGLGFAICLVSAARRLRLGERVPIAGSVILVAGGVAVTLMGLMVGPIFLLAFVFTPIESDEGGGILLSWALWGMLTVALGVACIALGIHAKGRAKDGSLP